MTNADPPSDASNGSSDAAAAEPNPNDTPEDPELGATLLAHEHGALADVTVELSLVLGETTMPIHQLLRMGRGAVITLDGGAKNSFLLKAGKIPVANADLLVEDSNISVSIQELLHNAAGSVTEQ